jgi:DNA-binding transcriptional LysR family regulator
MRIEQLLYFLDVARTLSITKSASNLYISPQGLSQSIVNLEREYGLTLFDRTRIGLALNSKGAAFRELAQELCQNYKEFERRVVELTFKPQEQSQSFYLYLPPLVIIAPVLQSLAERLGELFPALIFLIREEDLNGVLARFSHPDRQTNAIGLATIPDFIGQSLTLPPGLTMSRVFSLPIVARVRKDSPLAAKKAIKRKELAQQPLVCFNEPVLEAILNELVRGFGQPILMMKGSTQQVLALHKDAVSVGLSIISNDSQIASVPIQDTVTVSLELLCSADAPPQAQQVAQETLSFLKTYYNQ